MADIVKFPDDRNSSANPPEIGDLGFGDIDSAFNMRAWLQRACERAGGRMVGGGFGGGVADIDIDLEGNQYNVTIKALPR